MPMQNSSTRVLAAVSVSASGTADFLGWHTAAKILDSLLFCQLLAAFKSLEIMTPRTLCKP